MLNQVKFRECLWVYDYNLICGVGWIIVQTLFKRLLNFENTIRYTNICHNTENLIIYKKVKVPPNETNRPGKNNNLSTEILYRFDDNTSVWNTVLFVNTFSDSQCNTHSVRNLKADVVTRENASFSDSYRLQFTRNRFMKIVVH